MRYILLVILIPLKLFPQGNLPFSLSSPQNTYHLPPVLREISGITALDQNHIACVQDESGIVYKYDLRANAIVHEFKFAGPGDYEDITLVGNDVYVLRSDGLIYEILDYGSLNPKINTFNTGVPAWDNEGLCYDSQSHQLLIGCKSKAGIGNEFKNKRAIFSFDIETKSLSDLPLFEVDLDSVKKFIRKNQIAFPKRKKSKDSKSEYVLKFSISAMNIKPGTSELFLISSQDHALFIFNIDYRTQRIHLDHISVLDQDLFNKPEGITFLPEGDLLVSNEAGDKIATILRFSSHKK